MNTESKNQSPCRRITNESMLRLIDFNLQRVCGTHDRIADAAERTVNALERIADAAEAQTATLQEMLTDMPSSPDTSGLKSTLEGIQSPIEGIQKGIEAISNAMLSKHDFDGIESALKGIQTEIGSSTYSNDPHQFSY